MGGITRHKALHPLSHHHRRALFVAMNLKRAGTNQSRFSLKDIQDDTAHFWHSGGKQHFREEEEVLLPVFAQYTSVDIPKIHELLVEHIQIRALMDTIISSSEVLVSTMNECGSLLESHIRKEERVIYPLMEKVIPNDKLLQMSSAFHVNDDGCSYRCRGEA